MFALLRLRPYSGLKLSAKSFVVSTEMENEPSPPALKPHQSTAAATPPAADNTNTMGMLCHLLALSGLLGVPFGHILGPLIMWLVKKDECPFVDECGKEALNFNISMTIYASALILVAMPAIIIPILGIIIFGLAVVGVFALFIVGLVFIILAALKANEGANYKYPLTIRFIK